ncbi:protein of unknown function (plasmid) [Rhodovastum atsumiense]|nr:protein of unknown function [Rhodovastum atsumiense]
MGCAALDSSTPGHRFRSLSIDMTSSQHFYLVDAGVSRVELWALRDRRSALCACCTA